MKNIFVIGLGYVGSATAIAIANSKNNYFVYGLDLNTKEGRRRINLLNKCQFPFDTNDLKLKKALKNIIDNKKNFLALSDSKLLKKANIVLVNINFDLKKYKTNFSFDLNPFKELIKDISSKISASTLIIINSTVPTGTCEKIILPIIKKQFLKRHLNTDNILLAHSYERVMPGKNYYNSIINYWRVYAGINKSSQVKCRNFLSSFINTKNYPLKLLDDTKSSETAKILENTYRAVNIALIDEWTKFSKINDINLLEVLDAIKMRPSHSNIMGPGIGVGGYCLTKDPLFADISQKEILKSKHIVNFEFSNLAFNVNKKMTNFSLNLIRKNYKNITNKKFLMLGLAYKDDIGDIRNSPSLKIYQKLIKMNAILDFYDPYVSISKEITKKSIKDFSSISKFDCIILAVKHSIFKKIKFSKLDLKKNTTIFDFVNLISPKELKLLKEKNINVIYLGK